MSDTENANLLITDVTQGSVTVIGLLSSGKSTYLAALWFALNRSLARDDLRIVGMEGNYKYVNDLVSKWVACEPLPRTSMNTNVRIAVSITDPSGQHRRLIYPDISGESFESYWTHRAWPLELDTDVTRGDGIMLFVSPLSVRLPESIQSWNKRGAHAEQPAVRDGEAFEERHATVAQTASKAKENEPSKWDSRAAPTAVVIVDLLEEVLRRRDATTRVSVVVSAWDVVSDENETPREWLASHLPLVYQYLVANSIRFETEIFGVSAQGGALPSDCKRLADFTQPLDRVTVRDSDNRAVTLLAPLRWALKLGMNPSAGEPRSSGTRGRVSHLKRSSS